MTDESREWRPGSFTKNVGWGPKNNGLRLLHNTIRAGFRENEIDIPRQEFRERVKRAGLNYYIPVNFFLFNKQIGGVDYIIFDELVYQAVKYDHSRRFDHLALFAFNFSYVGSWKGARAGQERPALWAFYYVKNRIGRELDWNQNAVSAIDIARFVMADPRYKAKTAEKLSTNLNYLYQIGGLGEMGSPRVERWWVDALFLAMDRLIEYRTQRNLSSPEGEYSEILKASDFLAVSGKSSIEKDLAVRHLLALYTTCGARGRFLPEMVRERIEIRYRDLVWDNPNSAFPVEAIHPSNPRIRKAIPRACAMIVKYAGFDILYTDEAQNFDSEAYVKRQTEMALEKLKEMGAEPNMSAEDLMKLTREL